MKVNRLNEANYGGAFDIADDQYFTREDIERASEEVLSHISETFTDEYHLGGCWFENGKFIVNIQDDNYNEYEAEVVVDMRKIGKPADLNKYALDVASKIIEQIKETSGDVVNESFTMYSISNREHEQEVDRLIKEYQEQGWNPWDSKYSGSKYYVILARRGEDGKGEFKAIQYSNQLFPRVIDITYKQAQGYDPIDDFDGFRRELGRKLLPQREGLTEASDVVYIATPTRGDDYKTFTSKDKVLEFLENHTGHNVFVVNAKEFKSLVKAAKEANRPNPTKFAFNRLHSDKKTKAFESLGVNKAEDRKMTESTFTDKIARFKKAFEFGMDGYKAGLKVGGAYNEEFLQWLSSLNLPMGSKEQLRLLDEYNKGWMKANLENWDEEKGEEKYSVGSSKKIAVEPIEEEVTITPDFDKLNRGYDVKPLEHDLLEIEGLVDIDYDLDAYGELNQVIILTKYDIPTDDNWGAKRRAFKRAVLEVARNHGLVWSGDSIEDHGGWFYFVFHEPTGDKPTNEGWRDGEYKASEGWTEADIELHKSTDWKARNYTDLPVPEDNFMHTVIAFTNDGSQRKSCKFIKYVRANAIFPPYYAPEKRPFPDELLGPMADGEEHNGYEIHNRYESQEVYDALFEDVDKSADVVGNVKEWYLDNFSDDVIGEEINSDTTFGEVYSALKSGKNVYTVIGVNDSVVRERVFSEIARQLRVPYNTVYYLWLGRTADDKPLREGGEDMRVSHEFLERACVIALQALINDGVEFPNGRYSVDGWQEWIKEIRMGCPGGFILEDAECIRDFLEANGKFEDELEYLEMMIGKFVKYHPIDESKSIDSNETKLYEGKQGFIKNHGDCRILYVGSTYVVTDNKGLNIGESPTMPGAEAIADEHSKKPIKEDIDGGHEVYGSWSVTFTITLEGEEVGFDDLSETSQEHISKLIGEGYVSGEVCEYDGETEDQIYGWWSISRELYLDDKGDIRWDDLDEASQEHIAEMVADGYTSGELCVWRESEKADEKEDEDDEYDDYDDDYGEESDN